MELDELIEVLSMIAALDAYGQRTATRSEAIAWQLVINHEGAKITPDVAQRAVAKFHGEGNGRPMAVGDLIRVSAEIEEADMLEARRERQRQLAERHALPDKPQPQNVRDRSEEVKELLAGLMSRYRNWDEVGHPGVRKSQASWNPTLAEKDKAAREARARKIAQERSAEVARRRAAGLDPLGSD